MTRKNKGNRAPVSAEPTANAAPAEANTANESGTEQGAAPDAEPEPVADPFADVPVVELADGVTFNDYTDEATSDPRKYAQVQEAARADRSPTAKGWKHERAMLVPGTNRKELKPGSVYGTIQQIVNAAGRVGIPAYVVANKLRRMQIGNKRSHYCEALPPIGWAEGWINTAITKSIAGVHATKQAPAIREAVTEGEANANKAEAQGRIASNG